MSGKMQNVISQVIKSYEPLKAPTPEQVSDKIADYLQQPMQFDDLIAFIANPTHESTKAAFKVSDYVSPEITTPVN